MTLFPLQKLQEVLAFSKPTGLWAQSLVNGGEDRTVQLDCSQKITRI